MFKYFERKGGRKRGREEGREGERKGGREGGLPHKVSLCQQILHNHVMFTAACHAKLSHDRVHVKTLDIKEN